MKKDIYFRGKGLTIRLTSAEINNLYRPNSHYKSESFDYIQVENSLNKKFAPVLLKEWFFLIKPGGFLIIDYIPTKDITFQSIEELLWWLFKGNYDIKVHKTDDYSSKIVVQKRKSMFVKDDTIDKWSFGIVTNGTRDDWLEIIIKSIRDLNIPNYEIIVCGTYRDRKEKDFTYINFNERSETGWIQKKKNLILDSAKYENLCVIHDRLVFDKNWFDGMKKYGNAFEILSCVQIEKETNVRAGDWLTTGGQIDPDYRIASMLYSDWDYYTFLSMQLVITKKSMWQKVLWNETKNWKNADDIDTSFRARDMGYIIRFNPYASVIALKWDHGNIPLKYDRSQGILPKDMLLRRTTRIVGFYLNKIPLCRYVVVKLYSVFMKTRFHKRFIYGM